MTDQGKTMSVPMAGKLYFDLGRNASYAAARSGQIPTIRIGRRLRALIPVLEQMIRREMKGSGDDEVAQ
jgi:hypothetical protein